MAKSVNAKILLTGSNGYAGSKLLQEICKKLGDSRVDPIDLCLYGRNLGTSRVADYRTIDDLSGYESVVHLAGHSSIGMCASDPDGAWRNNVEGFRRLCGLLQAGQRLVFASSASVYPTRSVDADEDMCIGMPVRQEYDMQKTCVELIGRRAIEEGKSIFGLRMGTVNGASPNTRADLMMNAMVKSGMEAGVVRASGVGVRRSILGIGDFTRAVLKVLTHENPKPGVYNIASFSGTVGEFAGLCAEATGASVEETAGDGGGFDFTLSTRTFSEAFEFNFEDTAAGIVESLVHAHVDACYDDRRTCRVRI